MDSALLELRDFQVLDQGTKRPLTKPFSLSVQTGTIHLVRGPNGVGKSSLIRALTSESFYQGGLLKAPNLNIATHPQISAPMFALPLRLSDILSWADELSDSARSLLGDLIPDRPWDSCSGGERQRVLLAMLFSKSFFLSKSPTLLLLDEPMNHLDEISQAEVISAIREWIKGGSNRGAIIVSHEDISTLKCEILTLQAATPSLGRR